MTLVNEIKLPSIVKFINPKFDILTEKNEGFMRGGKVGGWKSKELIVICYSTQKVKLFCQSDKLTISQAKKLHEECVRRFSGLDEIPDLMEYGKQPFTI